MTYRQGCKVVGAGAWWLAGVGCLLGVGAVLAQSDAEPARRADAPNARADADVIVVEAEGEGLSKEEALKAALRAALEKGGRQEIFSDSKVENFQLMHDTIISRAQGIVKDYKILEEKRIVGGTWKTRIKAQVSKSVLASTWGEVQNVLKQMGRPKILVSITERIDGEAQEQSALATLIQKKLLKSGFEMVSERAMAAIREKEAADAAAEDNIKKVQAIAKEFGAQIFIAGTANANQAGIDVVYDVPIAFYNSDAQLEVYYTDTGRLLASEALPSTRGGARGKKEFSPQAARMALANSAEPMVNSLYQQIMEKWATDISTGGELTLELQGANFKEANDLKKAIAAMEKVDDVQMKLTKGIATYQIKAKLSAEELAVRLSEGEFEELLEIIDLKMNRLQAQVPEE